MHIRVVVRPDDLFSASDFGMSDDDDAAVQAAVQFLDGPYGYLGASLGVQTIEASYYDWCEAGEYFLPGGPVIAINSVKYLDISGVEQTVADDQDYYRLIGDRIVFTTIQGTTLYAAADAVRINYQAGYDGEDDGTGPLPAPIQQAIGVIAKQMAALNVSVAGQRVKSIEVPGVMTKSYDSWSSSVNGQTTLQNIIGNMLSGYMRRSMVM